MPVVRDPCSGRLRQELEYARLSSPILLPAGGEKEDEHAGQKADASQCKQGKRSCNDIGHIVSARNKIALSLTLEHDQMNGLVRFEVVRRGAQLGSEAVKEVEYFVGGGVDQLLKRNEVGNSFAVSLAIDGARRFGVVSARVAVSAGNARRSTFML